MSVAPRVLGISISAGGGLVGAKMAGLAVLGSMESNRKDIACLLSNGIPCYVYDKPMDFSAVPRTDVIFCCNRSESSMERLRDACAALQPRVLVVEEWKRLPDKIMDGFVEYRDVLDWSWFGCPIKDSREYAVAFRKDMLPLCQFPFPDATETRSNARAKLDANPDPRLFLTDKEAESVRKREKRNRSRGFRFGPKYLVDGRKCPRIPQSFYLDRRHILVEENGGLRKLSVNEVMKLLGMPDGWRLPDAIHDSYRLASTTSPPPVLKALFEELLVWIR